MKSTLCKWLCCICILGLALALRGLIPQGKPFSWIAPVLGALSLFVMEQWTKREAE